MENRFQRVVLNGQTLKWLPVRVGVPQVSILGPLFFLIYINDLSVDITSTVKLFADDASLSSIIHDAKTTAYELNKDLQKIAEWAHQWKMSFNPDLNKQAQEVMFSRKMTKPSHPQVFFNDIPVSRVSFQKHLGIYLDEKLNFNHHIKEKMTKAMKGIGVFKRLSKILPRHSLLTIYKSFVRPHLDYGNILHDQPNNKSFSYNAALAITGAIKGTSQIKLYNELGLESLQFRRWFRKLCLFCKIKKTGLPEYLFNMIPKSNHQYNTWSIEEVTKFYSRTDVLKYSYFPHTILEWNKLDVQVRRSESFLSFKNSLLKIGRPIAKPTYNIHKPIGLKFLTRLRPGLSHLNEHKFKHNVQDWINSLCS